MADGIINNVARTTEVGNELGDGGAADGREKVLTAALINVSRPLTNYCY